MTDANRKPIRLRDLAIDEGSIVDDGANPFARVVFWKRHKKGATVQIKKSDAPAELTEEMLSSLPDEVRRVIAQQLAIKDMEISNLRQSIAQTEAQHSAEKAAAMQAQEAAMQAQGAPAGMQAGAELPPGSQTQPPGSPGSQQKGANPMNAKPGDLGGMNAKPPGLDETETEETTEAGAVEGGGSAAKEGAPAMTAEEQKKKEEEAALAQIAKRLPEPVKIAIAKRDAEIAELRKSLSGEIEIRKRREYEDEALRAFSALPLPRVEIAKALRAADDAGCGDTIRKAFSVSAEIAKSGVSVVAKRYGRAPGAATGSVEERVEAVVIDLRKRNPALTREAAIAQAYVQNPDLYAEYRSASSTD